MKLALSVLAACLLATVGVDAGGREMPQAMVDEMMGGFFKIVDQQIVEVDGAVSEAIKGVQGGFEHDLKQLMKDIKSDMSLSSPIALASQFTEQLKVFFKQYPGRVVDSFAPLGDAQSKIYEQLEKLPVFKFKDRRAPELKAQFRGKFQAEVDALGQKAREASEGFSQFLAGYRDQMVALLQKQGANDERAPKQIPEIHNGYSQGVSNGKQALEAKLQEFTPGFFAIYDKPPAADAPK